MTHHPKGGMCCACQHARRNCSTLPFKTMLPIQRDANTVIVRCTDFKRQGLTLQLNQPAAPGGQGFFMPEIKSHHRWALITFEFIFHIIKTARPTAGGRR